MISYVILNNSMRRQKRGSPIQKRAARADFYASVQLILLDVLRHLVDISTHEINGMPQVQKTCNKTHRWGKVNY